MELTTLFADNDHKSHGPAMAESIAAAVGLGDA